MTDSIRVFEPGFQVTNASGDPQSGAVLRFYNGTTAGATRTVYSDSGLSTSLGVTVTCNSSGRPAASGGAGAEVAIYTGTTAYAVKAETSAGVTLWSFDNLLGALDTSGFTPTTAKPETPVISKTSNYTIVDADQASVINANPTGGSFVLTMPSSATVGDGWRITIRHVGTAGTVTIATVSSQTIDGATSRALGSRYESLCLVSDGANWHIDGHAEGFFNYGNVPWVFIENRTLTAPPASPTAGARYILGGTGTGAWSSYSANDVLESDGQGAWIRYSPVEGWHGYDKNANQDVLYTGSTWEGLPATDDPASSNLGIWYGINKASDGVAGASLANSAWTIFPINTEISNTITGASFASNAVTLPAGKYLAWGSITISNSSGATMASRLANGDESTIGAGHQVDASAGADIALPAAGYFDFSGGSDSIEIQYYSGSGTATGGNAIAASGDERYAWLLILDLESLQGTQGDQGAQGPQGFAGFKFQYSTNTTTGADPGTGTIRLNNADLSLVTSASIDATSNETGNPDVSDEIAAWDDMGILKIAKIGAEQNWVTYDVTNVVDNTGYLDLTLAYRDHAGSFSNTDAVSLGFAPAGQTGASGSSAFVFDYQFNTATSGDPGSGKILFDNATLSSATAFNIHETDRLGTSRSADIATWDDDGATANRGYLYIINATTGARIATFKVTGTITDNGSYDTFSATYIAGSAPANDTRVAVIFIPAGATGSIGGSLTATDNLIVRTDGTGGTTIQAGVNIVSDSGDITFPEQAAPSTPASGKVALYAKSDGRFYEKDDAGTERGLSSVGKHTIVIPASSMLAATTSGPAAASLEATTNKQNYKVLDFDASADEFAHFQIPMPKGWNESTVTFRVFWSTTATDTDGVAWALEGVSFADGDTIDTAWGTAVVVTDAAQSTAGEVYVTAESSAVTIAGTPGESELCFFRLSRDVSDAADTMAEDARLIAIQLFFNINAPTDD